MAHHNSILKISLFVCILGFLSFFGYGQEVSTLAGLSIDADGPAAQASFAGPEGVAVDAQGNIYVADWANEKIRKISPQGVVSTLAGSGTRGYLDGTGAEAMFSCPRGLALDKDGNLFVAESCGGKIRKVTPEGVVTTVAKSPPVGPQPFFQALALVVDNTGNIYVADYYWVTKITPDGEVSKLAGSGLGFQDGPGATAKFKDNTGITIGADGNLYVVDQGNNRIRKITPQGEVSTFAGSVAGSQNGNLSVATFNRPHGITTDKEGNMYVSEINNSGIRKISTNGEVSTLAGIPGASASIDGPVSSARFSSPLGLAADGSGNLYIAENGSGKIRKISADGIVSTVAGVGALSNSEIVNGNGTLARFRYPIGTAVDASGNVYVADKFRVRKVTPSGTVSTFAGSGYLGNSNGTAVQASFYDVTGIAVDATGNVFVSDIGNHNIRKITPQGVVSTVAGSGGSGYADGNGVDVRFNRPSALVCDAAGNLYVTDQKNYCIRKITPNGDVTTFAGTNTGGYQDGNGADARFSEPTGITIDKEGNLYVVDKNSHRIRKITPQGVVSTFAGSNKQETVNGTGINARFNSPNGICIDASGNLYVTQIGTESYFIRKITPAAVVTTLAGKGLTGSANGPGATARFRYPTGIAVDKNYNLYVADQGNYLIRKITLPNAIKVLHSDNELVSATAPVDFGIVKPGKSGTAFSFRIESGAAAMKPLFLLGNPIVTVSGSDFIVDQSNTSSSVEIGGSTEFTITFKPTTAGVKTATVTIPNNNLDGSDYTFEIKGITSSDLITGIESSTSTLAMCYPNPASSTVILNSPEAMLLEVYSCDGTKLMEQMVEKGENTVNIESLQTGLYIFNMSTIGQRIKVMKE